MSKLNLSNLKKTWYYLRRNGFKAALGAAEERVRAAYYRDYVYYRPKEEELSGQRERKWENPLLFSILVPAYETREDYLKQLVDSLLAQTYPHWELILADASLSEAVRDIIGQYRDERIRYIRLENNGGISENSNEGVKAARGEYVGLLDHDDWLTPDALYEMALALEKGKKEGKKYAFLYSDEDKCDSEGKQYFDPHFKMDFNLDLLLTNNYICHFLVMKRELLQLLGFRSAYDGAQDYDLVLRALSYLLKENPGAETQICHLPRVLYHWRCHKASTAANPRSKSYAYEAGKRALEDFLKEQGWKGRVSHMPHKGFYRIEYENGVFAQRPDVAAMGGRLVRKGKLVATAFDAGENPLYQGLPAHYSGYMHRAVLAQDVECLDSRYWKINPNFLVRIETFLQEAVSIAGEDKVRLDQEVCRRLLEEGYRLYWNPDWMVTDKEGR